LQLFDLFWSRTLLRKIVTETNRYAIQLLDVHGNSNFYGRSQMDEFDDCGAQGISSHPHVHGDEKATQYEVILGKRRLFLSLSHHQ
jgi:hypothetical protein